MDFYKALKLGRVNVSLSVARQCECLAYKSQIDWEFNDPNQNQWIAITSCSWSHWICLDLVYSRNWDNAQHD